MRFLPTKYDIGIFNFLVKRYRMEANIEKYRHSKIETKPVSV